MKNVIIFGAGKCGRQLHNMMKNGKIDELNQYHVKYFCDNYCPSGSYVDGIEIIHPYDLLRIENLDIIISTVNILDDAMIQLKKLNIPNNVYAIADYTYKYMWNNQDMPFLIEMDINKPRLPYLECKIASQCNLNCNGCSVAANISERWFMSSEQFERDLIALKKIYTGIKYLKLFGGEPLLNRELGKLLKLARQYFPDSELVVHSNGILVPEVSEELLVLMHKLNVGFVFTLYPETGKKQRIIEQKLAQCGVGYEFTPPTYEFRKCINLSGDYNPIEIYNNCCKCINLIDGTLSCGFGYLIDKLEKKYKTEICDKKFENCINIYDTHLDGWQINKKLDSPYNLCAYCAFMRFNVMDNDKYYYEWKHEKAELKDWCFKE